MNKGVHTMWKIFVTMTITISFVNNISCLCLWCNLCVFVTTAPFKTEDNWINETKQSQPEVIYETRGVST